MPSTIHHSKSEGKTFIYLQVFLHSFHPSALGNICGFVFATYEKTTDDIISSIFRMETESHRSRLLALDAHPAEIQTGFFRDL